MLNTAHILRLVPGQFRHGRLQLNVGSRAANGLIHAWPSMAQLSGPYLDLSGHGESGLLTGVVSGITRNPGPIGMPGAYAAGGNEYVSFGAQGFGAEWSFNTDGTLRGTLIVIAQMRSTAARAIIAADYSAAGGNASLRLECDAAGTWTLGTLNSTYTGGATDLLPHCFAFTRFGFGLREAFFVDGVVIASTASAPAFGAGTQMAIGSIYTGSINLDGWVYDVRMYDRAMSDEEVHWHSQRANWFDAYRIEESSARIYSFPTAAGGFSAAWARPRSAMLGSGVR